MFKKSNYVYTIYKEGSFTKASLKLGVSQPCLSAVIKNIERRLGAPLFERSSSPVVLTQVGYEYIKTAEQMMKLQESLMQKISNMNSCDRGSIRLGCPSHVLSFILPAVMSEFRKRCPKVTVNVTEADTSGLITMLRQGSLDLVMDSFDSEPSGSTLCSVADERLLLAVPCASKANDCMRDDSLTPEMIYSMSDKSEMSSFAVIPLDRFADEQFVLLKSGNAIYDKLKASLEKCDFVPRVLLSVDQLSTAYSLAVGGSACTFVTSTMFSCREISDPVRLYNFRSEPLTFGIVHKRDKHIIPAMQKFIDVTKEVIEKKH